jgi:hypothetical protein
VLDPRTRLARRSQTAAPQFIITNLLQLTCDALATCCCNMSTAGESHPVRKKLHSTYVLTNEGVSVNGSAVDPWRDAAEAPQQLKKIADTIQAMHDRFSNPNDPHVVHGRYISCGDFHPKPKAMPSRNSPPRV